ncbi:substrate-binding periplasmic protein [Dongia sp.]|uniref:substrate-binding periplasmic protein n=1 Tax=Dongia sp. TaxID=1977262 RepID=UPI0035B28E29
MGLNSRHLCALAAAALLWAPSMAVADDIPLRVGYSDKESAFYLVGNGQEIPKRPGVAIEMVKQAAEACGVSPEFSRYPGGRLLARVGDNTIDAVALLSFNRERMALATYPMKGDAADPDFQIASLSYAFYVRSDSPVKWDGMEVTGLTKPIGANLGWSIVDDLKKEGLDVEPASDTQNNFNKLLGGRIDAVATHVTIGDAYVAQNGLTGQIKRLEPPISTKPYYLVLSHAWRDAHGAAADCLWASIAKQRRQDMPALLQRYRDTTN